MPFEQPLLQSVVKIFMLLKFVFCDAQMRLAATSRLQNYVVLHIPICITAIGCSYVIHELAQMSSLAEFAAFEIVCCSFCPVMAMSLVLSL